MRLVLVALMVISFISNGCGQTFEGEILKKVKNIDLPFKMSHESLKSLLVEELLKLKDEELYQLIGNQKPISTDDKNLLIEFYLVGKVEYDSKYAFLLLTEIKSLESESTISRDVSFYIQDPTPSPESFPYYYHFNFSSFNMLEDGSVLVKDGELFNDGKIVVKNGFIDSNSQFNQNDILTYEIQNGKLTSEY